MIERSDADAGAASSTARAHGEPAGGAYARSILPTLRRIRAARLCAEALARRASSAEVMACVEHARASIAALDQRLRATGIYDLAQPDRLDKDAQGRAQACLLIDEARRQLHRLAHRVCLRAERCGAANDAALAELIATLDAPHP